MLRIHTLSLLLLCTPIMAQHGYKKLHFQMLDQAKSLLANEEYVEAAKVYKRLFC